MRVLRGLVFIARSVRRVISKNFTFACCSCLPLSFPCVAVPTVLLLHNKMRAVRCHRFAALDKSGKPISKPSPIRDVLSLEKIPSPTLTAADADKNKVLISTHYAGIQYPDFLQAQGCVSPRAVQAQEASCPSCFVLPICSPDYACSA